MRLNLRLATLTDYSFYEKLYKASYCDMIYYRRSRKRVKENQAASGSPWQNFVDEETLAQIEEAMRPTLDKFEAQIEAEYNRIFIILDGDTPIGIFDLSLANRDKPTPRKGSMNRWKMHDFWLVKKYQVKDIAETLLDLLMQERFMDEIDVAIPDKENAKIFLRTCYEDIGGLFYRRKKGEQLE